MATEVQTKMIGIVCERSVDLDGHLDANNMMNDDPTVKIIKVPCSGHIQPIMLETALKLGADGVFATGCRMGDCHYREGNKFLRERLLGERMPKLKPNVDKKRVRAFWLSALEYNRFKEEVCQFHQDVDGLGPSPNKPSVPASAATK
ncbi:MAG: hydrogenase iron-sulfur subunit [Cyanobacteria bacterium]|nr:hydrogenase iron-sulfur subunit [Cyanobacteriota bacterium]